MCILELCAEGGAAIDEISGKGIRIRRIDKSVPAQRGWRLAFGTGVTLSLDLTKLHAVSPDDGKKRIQIRLLKCRLKSKLFTIEFSRLIHVADDEES